MSEEQYLKTLARYSQDIRTGALEFNYRTGACGPAPATQTKSWGSACPPGVCLPDNLPAALNRYFAGDRAGCKELPYCLHFSGTSSANAVVPVTRDVTSKITMCPTRMIGYTDSAPGQWEIAKIEFGNQNQIVGDPVAVEAFAPIAFQVVPMVPDCLRAGLPFSITLNLQPEQAPTLRNAWLVFIGPMVG